MELYVQVRRSVYVEGLSEREAARRFGIARVRKMLRYRTPPGYRRSKPVRRPKLEAFTGIVDQILRDRECPRKQRHTAQRIPPTRRNGRLHDRQAKKPCRWRIRRATPRPTLLSSTQTQAPCLVVDLPHSDDAFVETTEAFCERHRCSVPLLRRRAAQHRLRQHEAGGGEDPGRRQAPADPCLLRAAVALSVRRPFWAAGQGQRQRQGGRVGGLCTQLYGADSALSQLGSSQRAPGSKVSEESRTKIAATL